MNTNEAAQERIIADAVQNETMIEDLDFTPRQMLMDYVRNGFPVAVYQRTQDSEGRVFYVAAKDSKGNQVFDKQAIAMRDKLLDTLGQIRVPENPLDSILNAFGPEKVAEITGRGRRFVHVLDENGDTKVAEEKRGKNAARADAEAFQGNRKDVLVFSGAGGTGYSFHADNTAINQRRRVHYILQPGWRADAAVQGFGRTHRTNQANEPHYVLPTTNLKAQKRFVSSIARRLDQLGALTRGQRETTSQGMFSAADNLESQYATVGLQNFFKDMHKGETPLNFQEITRAMGLNLMDENGTFSESKIPGIPQFLNRLLSLKTEQQNAVFAEFDSRLVEAVEYAKQQGKFDEGLQTLRANSIVKTRDVVVHTHARSGATTRYVQLDVEKNIEYISWTAIELRATFAAQSQRQHTGFYVVEQGKSKGNVCFLTNLGERINHEGKLVQRGSIQFIRRDGLEYMDDGASNGKSGDFRFNKRGESLAAVMRRIGPDEAKTLWESQIAAAPVAETKTEGMLVGVILPIWDRVAGDERITRLQTDDGEQLLGRRMNSTSAKQTLKNLIGADAVKSMTSKEWLNAIKDGQRAILANGWEISNSRVNGEMRLELKTRFHLTHAEKGMLLAHGAFMERIDWKERVFIPQGVEGQGVFDQITEYKPVVDLLNKGEKPGDARTPTFTGVMQQFESEMNVPRSAIPPTPINPDKTNAAFNVQEAFVRHGGSGDIDESTNISAKSHAFAEMAATLGYSVANPGLKYMIAKKDFGSTPDGHEIAAVVHVRISDHSNVNRGHHFGEIDINIAPDDGYPRDTFDSALRRLKGVFVDDDLTTIIPPAIESRVTSPQHSPPPKPDMKTEPATKTLAATIKKPFHETVAEKLIERLRQGTAPWQRPWRPGNSDGLLPMNPCTGKRYKGINSLHLSSQDFSDPRWLTYKQASAMGAQVRKGQSGTQIQYWKFSDEVTKRDTNGKPVFDANGDPEKTSVKLERPRVFFATVFNAEQIDGLPVLAVSPPPTWASVDRAEAILKASGAVIFHSEANKAFYRTDTDSIHLPSKDQFKSAEAYYATALHELGHWTGHETRLDRDLSSPYGKAGYAKEELRAEIASMILGETLQLGNDPERHASYVSAWIKILQDDPLEVFRAAADAEKIHDFVLGFEQSIDQVNQVKQEKSEIKTYINVPFTEKEQVKALGGLYDREASSWYVPAGHDLNLFAKYPMVAKERIDTAIKEHQQATQAQPKQKAPAPKSRRLSM